MQDRHLSQAKQFLIIIIIRYFSLETKLISPPMNREIFSQRNQIIRRDFVTAIKIWKLEENLQLNFSIRYDPCKTLNLFKPYKLLQASMSFKLIQLI